MLKNRDTETPKSSPNSRKKLAKPNESRLGFGTMTSAESEEFPETQECPETPGPKGSSVEFDSDRGGGGLSPSPAKGENATRRQLRSMARTAAKARAALERGLKDRDLTEVASVNLAHALNGLLQTELRLLEKLEKAVWGDIAQAFRED
jgi:hypothetical protein